MGHLCAVPGCSSREGMGISMHSPPKNVEKWAYLCGISLPSRRFLVCSKHFTRDQYTNPKTKKLRLIRGSLPRLFLPKTAVLPSRPPQRFVPIAPAPSGGANLFVIINRLGEENSLPSQVLGEETVHVKSEHIADNIPEVKSSTDQFLFEELPKTPSVPETTAQGIRHVGVSDEEVALNALECDVLKLKEAESYPSLLLNSCKSSSAIVFNSSIAQVTGLTTDSQPSGAEYIADTAAMNEYKCETVDEHIEEVSVKMEIAEDDEILPESTTCEAITTAKVEPVSYDEAYNDNETTDDDGDIDYVPAVSTKTEPMEHGTDVETVALKEGFSAPEEERANINGDSGENGDIKEVIVKAEPEDDCNEDDQIQDSNFVDIKIEVDDDPIGFSPQKSRFTCDICVLQFKNKTEVIEHRKTHANLFTFICSICGNSYKRSTGLREHMKTHSDAKPYKCTDCGNSYKWKQSLVDHEKMHSDLRPFACELCDKTFKYKQCLVDHGKTHREERPHHCPDCGMTFKWRQLMLDHQKIHSGVRPFSCDICGKSFFKKYRLKVHLRIHTGVTPFCCQDCGKKFRGKRRFQFHEMEHRGETPFPCDECNKVFFANCDLMMHKRRHSDVRPFQCELCFKGFVSQGTLNMHVKTHNPEHPFTCGQCQKAYKTMTALTEHERIHSGDRPHVCPVCDRTFAAKSSYNYHVRSHSGAKPFSCSYCGKHFARKRNLVDHERSHSGVKPFICPECGKGFSIHASLKAHIRGHSGEKPHGCAICGNSFTHRHHLLAHERLHAKKGSVLRPPIKKKTPVRKTPKKD